MSDNLFTRLLFAIACVSLVFIAYDVNQIKSNSSEMKSAALKRIGIAQNFNDSVSELLMTLSLINVSDDYQPTTNVDVIITKIRWDLTQAGSLIKNPKDLEYVKSYLDQLTRLNNLLKAANETDVRSEEDKKDIAKILQKFMGESNEVMSIIYRTE